jgi:HSP20 family protein
MRAVVPVRFFGIGFASWFHRHFQLLQAFCKSARRLPELRIDPREILHKLYTCPSGGFIMVMRRNGSHPVALLRDEVDRLVGDFFGPLTAVTSTRGNTPARGYPALNVWEDGDTVFVEAEVPGLKSEDFDIAVMGNELTIRGQRGEPKREGAAYHRQERGVGQFNRVLLLPVEVDANRVEASLSDGVLLIKLPKAESAKPKKIKVSPAQ